MAKNSTKRLSRFRHFLQGLLVHSFFGNFLHPLWAWFMASLVSAGIGVWARINSHETIAVFALGFFCALSLIVVLSIISWQLGRNQTQHALPNKNTKNRPKTKQPILTPQHVKNQDTLPANKLNIFLEQRNEYAFLVVTNSGSEATFWARLEATKIQFPDEEIFARWDHSESHKAIISTDQTRRLRIGRRETIISDFKLPGSSAKRGKPLSGSWQVPYCTIKKVGEAQPFYIGLEGPVFEMSVAIFASPELRTDSGSIVKRFRFSGNSVIEL
jgi:hypothetical protein